MRSFFGRDFIIISFPADFFWYEVFFVFFSYLRPGSVSIPIKVDNLAGFAPLTLGLVWCSNTNVNKEKRRIRIRIK